MPFAASTSVWIWVLLASCCLLLVWRLPARLRSSRTIVRPETGPPAVAWGPLAQGLGQAPDAAQVLQLGLGHLAQPLALGAGLAALWDAPNQRLTAVARWGGEGAELPGPDALGLLQQCALGARPQCLEGPAAAGLRIRSGLGSMAPRSLLLWPLRQGPDVLGVLELASLRVLTAADQQLLQQLEPLLVLAMRAAVLRAGPAAEAAAVRPMIAMPADASALVLVRKAPVPMALYAESGRPLALSEAWCQWLGLAPELASSRNLGGLWLRPGSHAELMRLLREESGVQSWSVDLAHAQGHALAVRLSACWLSLAGQPALLLVRAG